MANYKNIFIMMPAKDAEDYSGAFTLFPQRQGFVLHMVSFANCASNEDKTGNLPIPGARQDWRSRWSAMLPGPAAKRHRAVAARGLWPRPEGRPPLREQWGAQILLQLFI
jgi:hypothetical protein